MTAVTWLIFALGAGVGAPTRLLIDAAVENRSTHRRPHGTLVVNAVGSFVLGVVTGLTSSGHLSANAETIIGVGFCGALTTFSTFAVETVGLLERGEVDHALKNVALHTTLSIGLAAIGYAIVANFS